MHDARVWPCRDGGSGGMMPAKQLGPRLFAGTGGVLALAWLLAACLPALTAQGLGGAVAAPPAASGSGPSLRFDVATIKPSKHSGYNMYFTTDRFTAVGVSLQLLVGEAYGAYAGNLVSGGPPWAAKDVFDVEAKINPEEMPKFGELTLPQRREMLKNLLAERFQLKVHSEAREVAGYAFEVAKGGPKLGQPITQADNLNGVQGYHCSMGGTGILGYIKATHCSVDDLAGMLTHAVAPKLVNQTGLPGLYDFELRWRPDNAPMVHGAPAASTDTENYPALPTALREQLGLKLVPIKAPIEEVVIDHAERPTEN